MYSMLFIGQIYFLTIITDAINMKNTVREAILGNLRLAPVLKTIFINVSYHILVVSLTLMALF